MLQHALEHLFPWSLRESHPEMKFTLSVGQSPVSPSITLDLGCDIHEQARPIIDPFETMVAGRVIAQLVKFPAVQVFWQNEIPEEDLAYSQITDTLARAASDGLLSLGKRLYEWDPRIGSTKRDFTRCLLFDTGVQHNKTCPFCPDSTDDPDHNVMWAGGNLGWVHQACWFEAILGESKPDWKPVRERFHDPTMQPFSGPMTVLMPDWNSGWVPESFEEQIRIQERQMNGETHSPADAIQGVAEQEYQDLPQAPDPLQEARTHWEERARRRAAWMERLMDAQGPQSGLPSPPMKGDDDDEG